MGGGALYRGAMSAADALLIVKAKDVLVIVKARTAVVVSDFRMMHSPKKCLSLAVEPEMPLAKYHHKKQPMAVTRKSRSDSNFKGLGQHCWLKAMRFFTPSVTRLLKARAIFQCHREACE